MSKERKKYMAIESAHDTKHIKLKWNVETKMVRVLCDDIGAASRHLSKLIERKLVGKVEGVIIHSPNDDIVVRVFLGGDVVDFLRLGHDTKKYKPKAKFSEILKKKKDD